MARNAALHRDGQKATAKKTGAMVHDAVEEVQHAARPRESTPRSIIRWALSVAAGGAIAWRSFNSTRSSGADPATGIAELEESPTVRAEKVEDRRQETGDRRRSADGGEGAPSDATPYAQLEHEAKEPQSATVPAKPVALGKELMDRFNKDECSTRAAALSFYVFLSIVPVLLFGLAMLGFFIKDPAQAAGYVQSVVSHMLPGREAANAAGQVIAQTHLVQSAGTLMHAKWWALLFGVLSLFWSALSLFVSASAPMNRAWDVEEKRSFIKLRLVCLAVFAATFVLFALSLVPSSGPDFVQRLHIPWLGLPKHPPLLVATALQIVFEAIATAFDVALFVVVYRFLPNAPVTWKAALFGGAVCGVLWEVFKKAFAVYLAHFGNMNKMYGALGGIVLLVTWIYYSCMLLLAGAILCKMYHEHTEEGGVKTRRTGEQAT